MHDDPPSSSTVTPGGRNRKYSEFGAGWVTAGSEAISSLTNCWISAAFKLGGGGGGRAIAPVREPCGVANSGTLYSGRWAVRGVTSTKSEKAFPCWARPD